MSGTANEFEEPGGNYPDSGTGGAPGSGSGTQDGPVLAQNDPTELERLDGIVVQTRADLAGEDVAVVEKSLRRRLDDAGIVLEEEEIEALARDLSAG